MVGVRHLASDIRTVLRNPPKHGSIPAHGTNHGGVCTGRVLRVRGYNRLSLSEMGRLQLLKFDSSSL